MKDDKYDISSTQIEELEAMQRSELIPVDASVIVIGNKGLVEWSPALIERDVINNFFGLEWIPERYEKIFPLTDILVKTTDPDAIMETLQEDFEDLSTVYVIADQAQINKIAGLAREDGVVFEPLREYTELGLATITIGD